MKGTLSELRCNMSFNRYAAVSLRPVGFSVLLPQDFDDTQGSVGQYQGCSNGITSADAIWAVVDGPDPDSGTSFEIGYACAIEKPVVLLQTDFRKVSDNDQCGVNLMLFHGATRYVQIEGENLEAVVKALREVIGND